VNERVTSVFLPGTFFPKMLILLENSEKDIHLGGERLIPTDRGIHFPGEDSH
jgi:hypothetical protein